MSTWGVDRGGVSTPGGVDRGGGVNPQVDRGGVNPPSGEEKKNRFRKIFASGLFFWGGELCWNWLEAAGFYFIFGKSPILATNGMF